MRPSFSRPTPMADSRFIESMRYAHDAKILELTIRGTRYRYYGVGERKATRLAAAPSAGAYYNAQIKGRHPRRKFRGEMTDAAVKANKELGLRPVQVGYEVAMASSWLNYHPMLVHTGGLYHGGLTDGAAYIGLVELEDGSVFTSADIHWIYHR